MNRRVDISHKTVIFITVFLLFLWLLFIIRDVLILLFISIIFMSALSPIVERLHRFKIPRILAVFITYIFSIGVLASLIVLVLVPLAEQIPHMTSTLPGTLKQTYPQFIDEDAIRRELGNITRNALGILSFTLTVVSNFVKVVFVAFITFYLLLQKDDVEALLAKLFGRNEVRAKKVIERIEYKLGGWLRGQMVLSILIGSIVYAMLLVLGVPYALPLAILAGLLEVVPVLGPIIAAVPAIALAYLVSPFIALLTLGGFFVIQQLENNLIVPKVMQRAVGLNPLVVILAIAIGDRLLGVSGALLAVPITVAIQLIVEEVLGKDLAV